jgi:hypothetical protein
VIYVLDSVTIDRYCAANTVEYCLFGFRELLPERKDVALVGCDIVARTESVGGHVIERVLYRCWIWIYG